MAVPLVKCRAKVQAMGAKDCDDAHFFHLAQPRKEVGWVPTLAVVLNCKVIEEMFGLVELENRFNVNANFWALVQQVLQEWLKTLPQLLDGSERKNAAIVRETAGRVWVQHVKAFTLDMRAKHGAQFEQNLLRCACPVEAYQGSLREKA